MCKQVCLYNRDHGPSLNEFLRVKILRKIVYKVSSKTRSADLRWLCAHTSTNRVDTDIKPFGKQRSQLPSGQAFEKRIFLVTLYSKEKKYVVAISCFYLITRRSADWTLHNIFSFLWRWLKLYLCIYLIYNVYTNNTKTILDYFIMYFSHI